MVWHTPAEWETVAYMTIDRIAECGGVPRESFKGPGDGPDHDQIKQGVSVLQRWCRINCASPPLPVSVRGRTGFAFLEATDALLFKLTWG